MPKPDIKPDHISGGFEWEKSPTCECGAIERLLDDKYLFAANVSDSEAGGTFLYVMPMDADGNTPKNGLQIAYCPCCGNKLSSHKKYPLKS